MAGSRNSPRRLTVGSAIYTAVKNFLPRGLIVLGSLAVTLASTSSAWVVETVDNTPGSGWACSLAIAPTTGKPHISYHRRLSENFPNFFEVCYATKTGWTWSKEPVDPNALTIVGETTSIALTELGTPVVTFSRSDAFLYYVIRSGEAWSSAATVSSSAGDFSSLVWQGTETNPNPLIAYDDISGGDQELAYLNNGSWASKPIEETNTSGSYCSMARLDAYVGLAFIRNGKLDYRESIDGGSSWGADSANQFPPFSTMFPNGTNAINALTCALAVAPAVNGTVGEPRAHIIFFTGSSYYYTTTDTENGLWLTPQLISQSGLPTGYYGSSIAVGTDGVVRVAFYDHGSKMLKYGERREGAWTISLVDNNLGGPSCSLKLDGDNRPRIAYTALTADSGNYVPGGLKFATFENPAPTKLSFTISGKTTRPAKGSSLVIKGTASANAHFIQWRVGKKTLKKVKVVNGRWTVKAAPLAKGKNKVQFRALQFRGPGTGGKATPFKIITVVRK